MPCFKSIIFYQYSPKTKLFLKKKCKIFKRLGLRPQTPKTAPSIANFWLRASALSTVYNHMRFRSFCFEQFFLHRSIANLVMLTIIDVGLC